MHHPNENMRPAGGARSAAPCGCTSATADNRIQLRRRRYRRLFPVRDAALLDVWVLSLGVLDQLKELQLE